MAATISWTQPSAQTPVQPALSLQAAARTAEQLRATLMSLAPSSGPEPQQWRRPSATSRVEMVDVQVAAPRVAILPPPPWSARGLRRLVRPELAARLDRASHLLPPDLSLGFWEGFRPLWVQHDVWKAGFELLRAAHPTLSRAHLEDILDTCIARPTKDAPHSGGRAVDVAVVDASGQVLEANNEAGRRARQELARALSQAGLSNYAPEWWHWSYDGPDETRL